MTLDSLMKAGGYNENRTCSIDVKTETQDSAGQLIVSWGTVVSGVSCRLEVLSGGKLTTPTEIYEKATHVLYMGKRKDVTPTTDNHSFVIDGQRYEILLPKVMGHWEFILALTDGGD